MFVLGYSAFTAYKVYDYYLLSESVEPLSMNWKIQKMAEDDFVVQANYQYQWQNEKYSGHSNDGEEYINQYAAQAGLEKAQNSKFKVWLNPQKPINSSLFKIFPLKYLIYSAILWLLYIYFIWLGTYVKESKL